MGMVYYGNYAQFYEIGRTEAIRELGFTYKEIEAMGIFMAVTEMNIRYIRPAKYDDVIKVRTTLKELPQRHIITFHSEIFNEGNKLLNTCGITLYFLDAKTLKPTGMPQQLKNILEVFFK
jgi:acyl-CoA thioester hydrolase